MPRPIFAFSLVASILLITGCDSANQNRSIQMKPEAQKPTAVKLVAVTETEIKRTSLQPATVHAFFRADIRAKATGFVRELNVDIGTPVKKDDVLAVLDVPEMHKQREVIQARIKRLQAEEQRYESAVKLADALVESAAAKASESEAQMAGAEASLVAAEAEFERTADLVKRGSLQEKMLDETRKKRDTEQALKDATKSAIESAKAEVSVAKAKLGAAKADLNAAQANTEISERELDELDELIKFATLTSPFDGVVTQRHLEPGDLVRQGNQADSKPLFVVSQVNKVRVRIPVPESDAPYINRGAKISLTFPSFSSEPIEGTVSRSSGVLDPGTRMMTVECDFDNADGKLIPGMFGQASIELSGASVAPTLPSRAIRFDDSGNAYVYAVSDDGVVSKLDIETGADDGNVIEVVAGIATGQSVIDAHLDRFSDGQKVRSL